VRGGRLGWQPVRTVALMARLVFAGHHHIKPVSLASSASKRRLEAALASLRPLEDFSCLPKRSITESSFGAESATSMPKTPHVCAWAAGLRHQSGQ